MRGPGGGLKRFYVILSDRKGQGTLPQGFLSEALRHLNHLGDLYLISEGLLRDGGLVVQLLEEARGFLLRYGFCRLNIRPVHPVRVGDTSGLMKTYQVIAHLGGPFHREALDHQVASRWVVAPVLRVQSEQEVREARGLARLLRRSLMIPSESIAPMPRLDGTHWSHPNLERTLLEEGGGPLEALIANALFDDLHEWASSSMGGFSLEPCPAVVVDCVRGVVQRCPEFEPVSLSSLFVRYAEESGPWRDHRDPTDALAEVLRPAPDGRCLRCWDRLSRRMRETIEWNRMEEQGQRVQHQLGVFALSRGDLEVAERHIRAVTQSTSSADLKGEGLMYLGIIHLQRGDLASARTALTEACSLLPGSGPAIYHLARCEFEENDYIAASELFDRALEMGVPPGLQDDLRLYLGMCHARLGEFSEVLDVLGSVRRASAPVHFYRGVALSGLGRPKEALECFKDALALGPDREDLAAIYFYAGQCLKEMGRFLEAVSSLNKALEADSRGYEAWNLLGYCLFRLKRHREAIGAFVKALEINPNSALDNANIGSNLRDLGDLEGASRWYRRALRMDPTLVWVQENLRKVEEGLRSKGNDMTMGTTPE